MRWESPLVMMTVASWRRRSRRLTAVVCPGRSRPRDSKGQWPATLRARRSQAAETNRKRSWMPVLPEVITHCSNTPDLLSDLRCTVDAVTSIVVEDDEPDLSATAPIARDWPVKDRLVSSDIDQLVESFKAGVTIPELVAHYGISRSSVKTLFRQRGVRRRRSSPP